MKSQNNSLDLGKESMRKMQSLEQVVYLQENKTDEESFSISSHPQTSNKLKFVMPALLLLNFGIFVYTSIAVGALVQGYSSLLNQKFEISSFSLYGSFSQMWEAGTYPLAIIILIFSGLWPFIKILLLGLCWFTPIKLISYQKRDKILFILDTFGKWSLIDSYFMIIMVVSFRYQLKIPLQEFNITITPLLDFYIFIGATLLSLVNTHVIIFYHRKCKLNIENIETNNSNNQRVQNYNKQQFGQQNKFQKIMFPLLIFIAILSLVLGYFLKVFSFEFQGVAGDMQGKDNYSEYSMADFGYLLPLKTFEPNNFGIRFLQTLYFIFTIGTPLIFLIICLIICLVPLKINILQKIYTFVEILYAWSSIDVLCVTVLSGLTQIKQFAQFMVGNKCDIINKILEGFEELFHNIDNPSCFDVQAGLILPGSIFLILASILIIFIGHYILRCIHTELQQQLEEQGLVKQSYCSKSNQNSLKTKNTLNEKFVIDTQQQNSLNTSIDNESQYQN